MSIDAPRKGVLAALWTPTTSDGTLLREEINFNIEYLKKTQIHGLLALGSTGEFPLLTLEQRKSVISHVVEQAAPLPVVVNVSDISPLNAALLAKHAATAGAAAIAVMAPGFYPSSQDQILAHFLHVAYASDLPCFLYNFPELTGTRINLETVSRFADLANMAGIKQSGGEFEYHRELIALAREKGFSVFSGADTRLPEVFGLGADGCIGGLVNILPESMLHLYHVCHDHQDGAIEPACSMLKELGQVIDRIPFPLNVAAGMEARGFPVGERISRVSQETQLEYESIVSTLREKFEGWKLPMIGAMV